MANPDTDNVTPLRSAKAKRADNTAALRQLRSRAKRKRGTPIIRAPNAQIAQQEKPNENKARVTVAHRGEPDVNIDGIGDVTGRRDPDAITALSRPTNYALVIIAYGFFALGIGINIWNDGQQSATSRPRPGGRTRRPRRAHPRPPAAWAAGAGLGALRLHLDLCAYE
jgi:hypothetical protein